MMLMLINYSSNIFNFLVFLHICYTDIHIEDNYKND